MRISIPFTDYEIVLWGEDEGRTQPTTRECIAHELSLPENANTNASFSRHNVPLGEIDPSILPSKYNDIEFGSHEDGPGIKSWKLVGVPNGQPIWCRTVGEYKAAQAKVDAKGTLDDGRNW